MRLITVLLCFNCVSSSLELVVVTVRLLLRHANNSLLLGRRTSTTGTSPSSPNPDLAPTSSFAGSAQARPLGAGGSSSFSFRSPIVPPRAPSEGRNGADTSWRTESEPPCAADSQEPGAATASSAPPHARPDRALGASRGSAGRPRSSGPEPPLGPPAITPGPFRVDSRAWGDNRRLDLVSQPVASTSDLARSVPRPSLSGATGDPQAPHTSRGGLGPPRCRRATRR